MTTASPRPQRHSRVGSETRQRNKKIDVRLSDDEHEIVVRYRLSDVVDWEA
jgi:hypothetical protein